MIDIQKFKYFENIEKSILVLAFVQLESENNFLRREVDRLNLEHHAMFEQLSKVQLPLPKFFSQPQQQQVLQRPPQMPQRPPQPPQRPPMPQRVNPPQGQPAPFDKSKIGVPQR